MRAETDGDDWEVRLHKPSASALYLHIPFCVRKCAYCDFPSGTTAREDPLMDAYRAAIELQLHEVEAVGLLEGCETAYVGGGTPTMLGTGLGELIGRIRDAAPVTELTCEANPDSLSDEVIDAVRTAGATRLSVGVQSLDDGELGLLGRIHTASEARGRVKAAVSSGLSVSCDLMCAIPGQTRASWNRTLSEAVSLGVGHVSVYPLMIEEGTALAARVGDDTPAWNDEDVEADRMVQAQSVLEGAGFSRYEVASYARQGEECRHNIAYWTGRTYLGLGTSAASMFSVEAYSRLLEICPQLPPIPEGCLRVRLTCTSSPRSIALGPELKKMSYDLEFLTIKQALAEDLMLGARLSFGLSEALVASSRRSIGREVDVTLRRLVDEGFLDESLVPTRQGWLLGNELYGRLWELGGTGNVRSASC